MKHKEWLGKKDLVLSLLEKADLSENAESEAKKMMKLMVVHKYIELMTYEESAAKLYFKFGYEISKTKYYRLFNLAVKLMEEAM